MAKGLQGTTLERLHIPTVWYDVIDIRCRNTPPLPCTHSAPRLCNQLMRAPFRPVIARICVQPMPCSRRFPLASIGLVFWAIAISSQSIAAWMAALTQRFEHRITSRKRKEPKQTAYPSDRIYQLWLLKHWPDLMSIFSSALHLRQNTWRFVASVSGSTRISLALQVGQIRRPPAVEYIIAQLLEFII